MSYSEECRTIGTMTPGGDFPVVRDIDVQSGDKNLNDVLADLKLDINVVDQQVQQIVKTPAESTDGNRELINIRTGADGHTYETAGDAVRTQITNLKNETEGSVSRLKEQINESESRLSESIADIYNGIQTGIFEKQGIEWESGFISADGAIITNRKTITSEEINVPEKGLYISLTEDARSLGYTYVISWKNADGSYKRGTYIDTDEVIFPTERSIIRLSIYLDTQVGTMPTTDKKYLKIKEKLADDTAEDDVDQEIEEINVEWESGFISADGAIITNRKTITSEEINVPEKGLYISLTEDARSLGYTYVISWKNADGSYKRGTYIDTDEVIFPTERSIIRLSIYLDTQVGTMPTTDKKYLKIKKLADDTDDVNQKIEEIKENTKNKIFMDDFYKYLFSKCICIGDSLTRGFYTSQYPNGSGDYPTYPQQLAKITGWNVTNAGKSGADAIEWYNSRLSLFTYNDKDVAIIFLGTNRGLADTVSNGADTTTNTGCYQSIVEHLHNQNQYMKIFVCTVSSVSGTESNVETTNKAIKDIANKYNYVYLLDINDNDYYDLNDDICHPSYIGNVHRGSNGYTLQAMVISNLINDTVKSNLTDFEVVLHEGKGDN